tara:strand:+ start:1295 stop:1615 length:321 start_codon:yes stop_codon:yes gene_type:complete
MDIQKLRRVLELPEDAPIPGAMYRRKQSNNHWEFATVIALEVLTEDRWVAVFSSVRFGEERITHDHNNLRSYELHSIPDGMFASPEDLEMNGESPDCFDLLLALEA